MGHASRERPVRLGAKLKQIRESLGFTQYTVIERLGLSDRISQGMVSRFERGIREPSLIDLLKYAKAAGVTVDALIDDEMDLPDKLPVRSKRK